MSTAMVREYDPAKTDDENFACTACGVQTVTGYDGHSDRGRRAHVYDDSDPRYLHSGNSECVYVCTGCGSVVDSLEVFPGPRCLPCWRPIGDAEARTMTAPKLRAMWGMK